MVEAMKAKDEARLGTVRMIKAALMKHKVDNAKEIDEAGEMQLLNMMLKQRHESADMFRKGDRAELAEKEESEAKLIESYMPVSATEAEIDLAIEGALTETGATGPKQMGVLMKAAQAKLAGKRIDGKMLSEKVKAKLG